MFGDTSGSWAVLTSINPPSQEVCALMEVFGGRVVCVGDLKTSEPEWLRVDCSFLGANHSSPLSDCLPLNHYSRKNLGYIFAAQHGASSIFDTDDDNLPTFSELEAVRHGRVIPLQSEDGWLNPYAHFGKPQLWPRGYPLELVRARTEPELGTSHGRIGIEQLFANGDPDLDAVGRLICGVGHTFEKSDPVVISRGTMAPVNSQSTFWRKDLFPLLYLPVSVTFRFTDILRGYIAVAVASSHGWDTAFLGAGVFQERNEHDPIVDVVSEVPMYAASRHIVMELMAMPFGRRSLTDDLILAYERLAAMRVVQPGELSAVQSWVEHVEAL